MDPIVEFLRSIVYITGPLSFIAFVLVIGGYYLRILLKQKKLPEKILEIISVGTINLTIILFFITLWISIAAWLIPTLITSPSTPTPTPSPTPETTDVIPTMATPTPQVTDTPESPEESVSCPDYPLRIGSLIQAGDLLSPANVGKISNLAYWPYLDSRDAEFIHYGPESDVLLLGLTDGAIQLIDSNTGELIYEFLKHQLRLTDLEVRHMIRGDLDLFATSSMDSSANLWLLSGERTSLLKTIKLDSNAVTTIAFSPLKGDLVATGDVQNRVHIWSIPAGPFHDLRDSDQWVDEEIQKISQFYVSDSSFSIDGQLLAVSSNDGTIQVYNILRNVDTNQAWLQRKREIQSSPIAPFNLVQFSPNDRIRLYAASDNGNLSIYNAETGALLGTGVSAGPLIDIAISNDGSMIAGFASALESTVVYVWDEYGNDLRILESYLHGYSVSFSPDGRFLATSDRDGIYIWGIEVDCETE